MKLSKIFYYLGFLFTLCFILLLFIEYNKYNKPLHINKKYKNEENKQRNPSNHYKFLLDITDTPEASDISLNGLQTQYLQVLRNNDNTLYYCKDDEINESLCYYQFPTEIYCRSKNLIMDLNNIEIIYTFDGKILPHTDISFNPGAFDIGDCNNKFSIKEGDFINVELTKSIYDIFISMDNNYSNIDSSICNGHWNDNIIYFVTRYDYVNVYHTTLDLFSMYMMAQVHKIENMDDIQVFFLDGKPEGSLDHLWEKFTNKPVQRFLDIKSTSNNNILCYKDSFFSCPSESIKAFQFLRFSVYQIYELGESELWFGFREFTRQKFNILHLDSFVYNSNPTITLILRKDYEKTKRNSLTKRKFTNEEEVTWEEQVALMAQTDILVGVHGAGLTQAIYLPDNSFVFEISTPDFFVRTHFLLLSRWLGHEYFSYLEATMDPFTEDILINSPIDLLHNLQHVIEQVRVKKCKKDKAKCQKNEINNKSIWNPPIIM